MPIWNGTMRLLKIHQLSYSFPSPQFWQGLPTSTSPILGPSKATAPEIKWLKSSLCQLTLVYPQFSCLTFETTCHTTLLNRLTSISITKSSTNWFNSCLRSSKPQDSVLPPPPILSFTFFPLNIIWIWACVFISPNNRHIQQRFLGWIWKLKNNQFSPPVQYLWI